jgi:superfamily II DNA or RNA helicase
MKYDVIISKKNEVYLKLTCEPHILYELAPYFQFEVEQAKFMRSKRYKGWNGIINLLNLHTKEIYVGLLDRLIEKIEAHGYTYSFENSEYYGLPYEENEMISKDGVKAYMQRIISSNFELRDYQVDAVYQALRHNRKLLVSPTSSGKSMCIYSICRYYVEKGLKVLIIVPRTSLCSQLSKDFDDYGWNSSELVHQIYSGYEKTSDKPVIVSTYQSLNKLDNKYFSQYDVVIVDECHASVSSSIQGILNKMCDTKYRFGFTGTTQPEKVHIWTLEGLFSPIYKVIRTNELMEKGNIAKLEIQIIILKHDGKEFNTYEEEIQYLITHEKRNNFIKNLALDLSGNTLILYSRVETHGQIIYDLINNSEGEKRKVFFVYGGVDTEQRERIREITELENNAIIVASYGVFSTGVSIRNLHNLIFASPTKSKIRSLQSIGRILRKSSSKNKAILYDIADDITYKSKKNYTLNHLIERIKIYSEELFNYQLFKINFKAKKEVSINDK